MIHARFSCDVNGIVALFLSHDFIHMTNTKKNPPSSFFGCWHFSIRPKILTIITADLLGLDTPHLTLHTYNHEFTINHSVSIGFHTPVDKKRDIY